MYMNNLGYSFLPKKEPFPIYMENQPCDKCGSTKSWPIYNMIGSSRQCSNCEHIFEPKIIGYNGYTESSTPYTYTFR